MNNLQVVIGIEIHVVVNTLTKMFSPTKNSHNDQPNVNIHPIDLAMPGTLPSVNKQVIVKALKLAKALNMHEVDHCVRFDRKNYFYQDLPKGFQITQYYYPFAKNGSIEIVDKNGSKKSVAIERFHIEEDTAKQIKLDEQNILLDFNRAGSPLFEIVTEPVFSDASEVRSYLINLRRILLAINVSDGRMEDGSMRADVNISVNPVGSSHFGKKVEIKNINSISNAVKAINFEIQRQKEICLLNQSIEQETRFYDDKTASTVYMRSKSNTVDYRYMTEPNILAISLSKKFVSEALSDFPLLPHKVKAKYQKEGLNDEFIEILLDNPRYQFLLNLINDEVQNFNESARWFFVELFGLINKINVNVNDLNDVVFSQIGLLINDLRSQLINNKQAKQILQKLVELNGSKTVRQLIDEFGYKQLSDEKIIAEELTLIIDQNAKYLDDYTNRPEKIERLYIGLLMKKKAGAVNPQVSTKVLRQLIQKRLTHHR